MGDDFDWLRSKGATNSRFTGPSNDHTLGTDSGVLSLMHIFLEVCAEHLHRKFQN